MQFDIQSFGVYLNVVFPSVELTNSFEATARQLVTPDATVHNRQEAFSDTRDAFHRLDQLCDAYVLLSDDTAVGYITMLELRQPARVTHRDTDAAMLGRPFAGLVGIHYVRFLRYDDFRRSVARQNLNGKAH